MASPSDLEKYLALVESDDAEAARVMDAHNRDDSAVYRSRGHVARLVEMLRWARARIRYVITEAALEDSRAQCVALEGHLDRLACAAMEKRDA